MIRLSAALAIFLACPAAALDLELPTTARLTVERNTAPDLYLAPVGVFEGSAVPTVTVEGVVERRAWRIDSPGLTPFQIIRPIRAQLIEAGYEVVLDCAEVTCGGFDFRFATETLPGPNMYVNIRAFHVVTAVQGSVSTPTEVINILASSAATSAYLQIIRAGADEGWLSAKPSPALSPNIQSPTSDNLLDNLSGVGHAVLDDLEFATGSTALGDGPFKSLELLATFLSENPAMRVALVGHTDSVGGLEPNISISRARARSVRERLITVHGVAPDRLDAEGMGYLAPVQSNLTAAGRQSNRRVEVVLLGPLEQ